MFTEKQRFCKSLTQLVLLSFHSHATLPHMNGGEANIFSLPTDTHQRGGDGDACDECVRDEELAKHKSSPARCCVVAAFFVDSFTFNLVRCSLSNFSFRSSRVIKTTRLFSLFFGDRTHLEADTERKWRGGGERGGGSFIIVMSSVRARWNSFSGFWGWDSMNSAKLIWSFWFCLNKQLRTTTAALVDWL